MLLIAQGLGKGRSANKNDPKSDKVMQQIYCVGLRMGAQLLAVALLRCDDSRLARDWRARHWANIGKRALCNANLSPGR